MKPVWVQNDQFWNFLTSLGKCPLLIALSQAHSSAALLGVGPWCQQEDAMFCLNFTQDAFGRQILSKNTIKLVCVQFDQFWNFLTSLGKCPLLIALSHLLRSTHSNPNSLSLTQIHPISIRFALTHTESCSLTQICSALCSFTQIRSDSQNFTQSHSDSLNLVQICSDPFSRTQIH